MKIAVCKYPIMNILYQIKQILSQNKYNLIKVKTDLNINIILKWYLLNNKITCYP
jgi:hypothetical protein